MSVLMMAHVFKRYPDGGCERLLALAIADHADDEGENIYPSVKTLAEKTMQSERTVQRQIRRMLEIGWLEPVWINTGGRGKTSEYRINKAWIKGDNLSPFKPVDNSLNGDTVMSPINEHESVDKNSERVTSQAERVTPVTEKGDTAMSPEPSLTIKNHQLTTSQDLQSVDKNTDPVLIASTMIEQGIKVTAINPVLLELIALGLTQAIAAQCIAIARTYKPGNEVIHFGYLATIISSHLRQAQMPNRPAKPSTGKPWFLDPHRIANMAWELRIVNATVTDESVIHDPAFQQTVLDAAGITLEMYERAEEQFLKRKGQS